MGTLISSNALADSERRVLFLKRRYICHPSCLPCATSAEDLAPLDTDSDVQTLTSSTLYPIHVHGPEKFAQPLVMHPVQPLACRPHGTAGAELSATVGCWVTRRVGRSIRIVVRVVRRQGSTLTNRPPQRSPSSLIRDCDLFWSDR